MDTTLRDGEQTSGVSFSKAEKLTICQLLLEELNVDRVEVASARVSEGEFVSVKAIMNWADINQHTNKIEVLSFVDHGVSIEWMAKAGVKVQNLLTKGSLNHLTHQLKKTPQQHFSEISNVIELAESHGITTNVYLEDWSNGMRNSPEYVYQYLDFLTTQDIKRMASFKKATGNVLKPYIIEAFIENTEAFGIPIKCKIDRVDLEYKAEGDKLIPTGRYVVYDYKKEWTL